MKIMIIFEINFDLKNFDFEIKKSKSSFKIPFIMRFKLINLDEVYEIYRKIKHVIHNCEILIRLKPSNETKSFLLKDKFSIL